MKRRLVLDPLVPQEIREAKSWYNKQRKGLGSRLYANIKQSLLEIRSHPELHGFLEADVRVALVPGFPFAIYYQAFSDRVNVVAVIHSSRDPDIWKSRLS